jgi:outer membrane protein assembly factor BamB
LYYEGKLYLVSDNGIVTCLRAKDGRVIWRERLGGNFSASPLIAGGRLYVASEEGRVFVIRPDEEFALMATNTLDAPILATPAACGNHLFVRTTEALFCIGGQDNSEGPKEPTKP